MTNVLQNFVPFLLYRVMAKSVTLATADYAELGLGIQDARVLMVVLHSPAIRVGELAKFTSIEQSAMSHILRRLSRRKLVSRNRVEHDNRAVEITLTPEGRHLAEKCQRIATSHSEILLNGMEPGDIAVLRRTLREMYANVESWAKKELEGNAGRVDATQDIRSSN